MNFICTYNVLALNRQNVDVFSICLCKMNNSTERKVNKFFGTKLFACINFVSKLSHNVEKAQVAEIDLTMKVKEV